MLFLQTTEWLIARDAEGGGGGGNDNNGASSDGAAGGFADAGAASDSFDGSVAAVDGSNAGAGFGNSGGGGLELGKLRLDGRTYNRSWWRLTISG